MNPPADAAGRTAVAVVVGTRPEAIKMSPVLRALHNAATLRPVLVATGQHRELLRETLHALDLRADVDLDVMQPGQTPTDVAARVLLALPVVLAQQQVRATLVQGDTTTAMSAALAAYHLRIPVGHVEAGLRTHDQDHPFPEEANREIIARLSRWHFAPTDAACRNLLAEGIARARVVVTGNTGVDALLWMHARLQREAHAPQSVLVTLHRRESFGEPLRDVVRGVLDFLESTPDARVLWPLHPNPAVASAVHGLVDGHARIELSPPLQYGPFVEAMVRARVILTDSGGVQEEAPSLGRFVLVARETTERPEALATGRTVLVGRNRARVREALLHAWGQSTWTGPLPAPNPFGDGRAAQRIVEALARDLGAGGEAPS